MPARRLFPEGGRHEAVCQYERSTPKGVNLARVPHLLEKEARVPHLLEKETRAQREDCSSKGVNTRQCVNKNVGPRRG